MKLYTFLNIIETNYNLIQQNVHFKIKDIIRVSRSA